MGNINIELNYRKASVRCPVIPKPLRAAAWMIFNQS